MRWSLLVALSTMLLPACYVGPVFELARPARRTCDADFLAWTGGLTHHVAQGRGDGSFDYDPLGDWLDRIEGDYDLGTGEFDWTATYAPDSFRESEEARGEGTLWRDGDMEIAYDLEVAYADGTEREWSVHTQRYGCDEISRVEDEDGGLRFVEGVYEDDRFVYEHTWIWGPLVVTGDGEREEPGRWEEEGKAVDGAKFYVYAESGDGEGEIEHEFDAHDGARDLVGEWTVDADGTIEMAYTSTVDGSPTQHWEYEVDGEGDGKGTWEYGDLTCDLKFKDFACSWKNCSDGSSGDCVPPVAFPVL